jgi:hypothetical protein
MSDRPDSSRWWYLTASALVAGVLLLPFARVPWAWALGSFGSDVSAPVVGALAFVSACLSASLYLDARRIGSPDWRPNPRLYAVGGALYPLSLVVGAWYLSERQWHVGLVGGTGPAPDEPLVASRWHYWIALGPAWCLAGAVAAALPLGLTGLLIGALCWIVGFGLFVLAINVDVRKVRAAELEWKPGLGRYTYPPLLAVFSFAFAPLIMLVVGGVYLFQRRRHLGRAA